MIRQLRKAVAAVIGITLLPIVTESVLAEIDNKAQLSLVFLGDSLTAGYDVARDKSYPALIQARAQQEKWNVKIVNAGISGDTTAGGVRRIDWLLRNKVDVFVLALGANDGLRGLPVEQSKQNLTAIIEKVKKATPETKILLAGMLVPPTMGENYGNSFREIFPQIAQATGATLIPFLLEGVAGEGQYNLADGIHPNEKGYQIVSQVVWQYLEPVLKELSNEKIQSTTK